MKKWWLILNILLGCWLNIAAQQFFNLTAQQVRIDSLLPVFSHSFHLGNSYADSLYTVDIEYPEFVEMTPNDVRRYLSISDDRRRKLIGDTLPELPRINTVMGIDRKSGRLDAWMVPIVYREGRYQKLVSFKLNLHARPIAVKRERGISRGAVVPLAASEQMSSRYAPHSVLASGSWAKITVPQSGIYELTADLIRQAGFTDLSKVKIYGYGGALQPEVLTADYLIATDDLKEVPRCVYKGKHLFFAQGPVTWDSNGRRVRNPYSNVGCYLMTQSDEQALTVDSATFVSSFFPNDCYAHTLYEDESFAWYHGGRNLFDATLMEPGDPHNYSLALPAIGVAGRSKGVLRVAISSDATTTVSVAVGDSVVGKVSIKSIPRYSKGNTGEALFTLPRLESTNKVTLTVTQGSAARLDFIDLQAITPEELVTVPIERQCGSPSFLYRITNQDLHAHQPVEMIIIIPTSQQLREQAERLKTLHEERDNMSVRIVPADELFNEFSSATPDATAYKRYLKMLYDRAVTPDEAPRYLVLFGDGAWDNRMCSSNWRQYSPDDFLLCFESENSFSETDCYVTDDFFCLLDDGEQLVSGASFRAMADMAVGRFPVRTAAEAKVMVDKVEDYMNNTEAGAWQNTVAFMGDDGNNNIHMNDAEKAATIVESNRPAYEVKRIYWDAYNRASSSTGHTYPEAQALVNQLMNNGALMMNYSGHGAPYYISAEKVLTATDFKNNRNKRLPLWFTASCDIMPFDGQTENIGELAVLNPHGGAIAFFGTTRTVFESMNAQLNNAFMRQLFGRGHGKVGMGEAARAAKNALVSNGADISVNKLQFTFLGDPALPLASPQWTMVVDSINNQPIADITTLEMKAGSEVNIVGHVERDGQQDTAFNGLLTARVRDAKQRVECKLNDQTADGAQNPYVFYDRTNYIFKGSDSIRHGRFDFSFAVPMDIQYSEGTGILNLYGVNNDHTATAHGVTEKFVFNGTEGAATDSLGPTIYCYLNSSSFVNGGTVNSTPYFVAEVSDGDGINAVGSGIGHEIKLVIDGKAEMTYVLNDYFDFSFGSYKEGRVGFSIPRLEAGEHQLTFKVWDVLNNSSTAMLRFRVEHGQQPMVEVDCTKNPAVNTTTFRIVHNRIGSDMEIVIDVFDMAGRLLYTSEQTMVPETGVVEQTWDLTSGSGQQLGTGVYLYRVRASSEGSGYVSKAKKLIIIR